MLVKALTVLKAKQHTFLHEALCRPSHRSLLLTKLYAVWFGISNRVFSVFGFCSYTRHNNVPLKCRQNHYTETENNKSPDRDEIQHLYLGGTTSPTGSTPPAGYMRRQLAWRGLVDCRDVGRFHLSSEALLSVRILRYLTTYLFCTMASSHSGKDSEYPNNMRFTKMS